MDVFEAIQARKSIRKYLDQPVPKETLEKILEAGRLAPSAINIQPWYFIAVTDAEKKKVLARGRYANFLNQAPLVIVICSDKKASSKWYVVDAALACENMILAAMNEGLGTCCVGSFDANEVKSLLDVPGNFEVVLLLAVGYPEEKFDLTSKLLHFVRSKKPLDKLASQETFGQPFNPKKVNDA